MIGLECSDVSFLKVGYYIKISFQTIWCLLQVQVLKPKSHSNHNKRQPCFFEQEIFFLFTQNVSAKFPTPSTLPES